MILIHGEFGSGKSAALRALEAAPPAGASAVYVPVPTLDFTGLARWALDRLRVAAGEDPALTLRELARRTRLALLIDDADVLPLETALALRRLEREAARGVLLVAACASERRDTPAIAALGPPAREIELPADGVGAVVALLAPWSAGISDAPVRSPAPGASPRLAKAAAAAAPANEHLAPEPRPDAIPTAAPPDSSRRPAAAPAQLPEAPPLAPAPPPVRAPHPRSVPLSLAVTMAVTAFLVPIAFGTGYLVGLGPRGERASLARSEAEPALPAVSAAPPQPAAAAQAPEEPPAPRRPEPATLRVDGVRAAAARAPSREAPRAEARVAALPPRTTLPSEPTPSAAQEPARERTRPRAAAGAPAASAETPAREPSRDLGGDPGWGPAPALISVEPGTAGR